MLLQDDNGFTLQDLKRVFPQGALGEGFPYKLTGLRKSLPLSATGFYLQLLVNPQTWALSVCVLLVMVANKDLEFAVFIAIVIDMGSRGMQKYEKQ